MIIAMTSANAILAVVFAASLRFGGERVDANGIKHSGADPELRRQVIAPVANGELRCRPTFVSCGVCFGAATPVDGLRLEYRVKDGTSEWIAVPWFQYFAETKDYRGSILDLCEDTMYEVRVGGKTASFRTWRSEVPISKTVVLDPRGVKYPITLSDSGTDDGWIRYTISQGDRLATMASVPLVVVQGATNVVLEGITFAGTKARNALVISQSENVRVVNCQFSHWGRPYEVRYDGLGRPFEIGKGPESAVRNDYGGFSPKGGVPVNFDGAIEVRSGTVGTVIERSWFHDCSIHANSWYYSHPGGGEGIAFRHTDHSTVVRWNDFTGSDVHRWNDAVESCKNFTEDGGLNRDADVYGNFMIFANDDCLELDGGQQNVRCFDNRFESAMCGVSVQGCMASPSYLFRNGFFSMCDEFGLAGQTVKTGGGPHGEEARTYIFKNIFWGDGRGLTMRELLGADVQDNVFCAGQSISRMNCSPRSSESGNRFGVAIAEADLPTGLPVRPVGFVLDRARFGGIRMSHGVVSPATLYVTAQSTSEKDVPFEVVWNDDTPWIRVEPRKGIVRAGGEQRFTVSFDAEKMKHRRYYRGAFLVRTPEGLSRGVSLYVETDFVQPVCCAGPEDTAVYLAAGKDGAFVQLAPQNKDVYSYAFTVPRDGRYHFLAYAKSDSFGKQVCEAALDEEQFKPCEMQLWSFPAWTPVAPGNCFGNTLRFWDMKAGERHVLRVRSGKGTLSFGKVVMTDNPGSFTPLSSARPSMSSHDGDGPDAVSERLSELLLSTIPDKYKPEGYESPSGYSKNGYGGRYMHYAVVSLWVNALECAHLTGNAALERRLVELFEPFYGPKAGKLPDFGHVDFTVVGSVPLEIAALTGDARAKELGLRYADQQWSMPKADDPVPPYNAMSIDERLGWWRKGYSDQTRLWIDDMYMINVLQGLAYRVTGERKYIDRAAKEMCLYLDELQVKEGPDAGLFHHAPDVPYVWGRGAGWMAAGMPIILEYLPADSEYRAKIMRGYVAMMEALKSRQNANGTWNQLVGDPRSWEETSCTAMFGFGFAMGVKNGWLDAEEYGARARKAYLAVVTRSDRFGNVQDVCCGTEKRNDHQYYLDRPHVHGDPHGQCALMWMCRVFLEMERSKGR